MKGSIFGRSNSELKRKGGKSRETKCNREKPKPQEGAENTKEGPCLVLGGTGVEAPPLPLKLLEPGLNGEGKGLRRQAKNTDTGRKKSADAYDKGKDIALIWGPPLAPRV